MRQPDRGTADSTRSPDFQRIYEEHVWDVYGFIGFRVDSREDAEDLTQATFERALRAWSKFDPARADAKTWLLAIARNLVIDHRRGESRIRKLETEAMREAGSLAGADMDGAALGPDPELWAALKRLSQREREIIALRFGGDLAGSEIAKLTGLSLSNVQQILSRSLRRLRDLLEGASESGRAGGAVRRD
jgi:RNA polymerase sigma-70 factor (ECF subfamily)